MPLSERQRPEQLINGNAQSGGIKRISDDGPDACSAVDRHQSGNYGRSARPITWIISKTPVSSARSTACGIASTKPKPTYAAAAA